MAIEKSNYLQQVLETHKMKHVDELMDKYKQKRDKVKEALEEKYSDKNASSPINSGSHAKHTAINTKFDIDICIPFKRNSFDTLEEMADALYDFFENEYEDADLYQVRKQRVSIGLSFHINGDEIQMDVVPGRELHQDKYNETYNLNLYVRPKNGDPASTTQTNIKKHIETVSGRNSERQIIRLLKIWKHENTKDYKSFLIELLTMKAFDDNSGNIPTGLWTKLKLVLEFIRDNIKTIQLKDPSNSNNIVSDTLTDFQKELFSQDIKGMIDMIEQNSERIKYYYPLNQKFENKQQNTGVGATVLSTSSFG